MLIRQLPFESSMSTPSSTTQHAVDLINTHFDVNVLQGMQRGIERESLRMQANGYLSQQAHPMALGAALTHPSITTDYSEALLEFITPPTQRIADTLNALKDIHKFTYQNLPEVESLWSLSMPCMLDSQDENIPIAQYGSSNLGQFKTLYRKGLAVRYGRRMQTISGVHYNLSFPDELFQALQLQETDLTLKNLNLQDYRSHRYFGLIRNFLRRIPLVLYLLGASPSVCRCFVSGREHNLQELVKGTMYLPHATALRMGSLGYQNSAQRQLGIHYNDLSGYLTGIRKATQGSYPEFSALGLDDENGDPIQINDHVLQIENEYYDSIRPKRASEENLRPYNQLKKFGIEYLEIRGIDIDPNEPTGISKNHIKFLDMILIYCLICPSKDISNEEKIRIDENDKKTVNDGRDYGIKLSINSVEETLGDAREKIYSDLIKLACCFENSESLIDAINFVKTYSRGILPETSYHEHGLNKAKEVVEFFTKANDKYAEIIKMEAELSIDKLNSLQKNSSEEMNEYVKNYNINL